MPIIKIINNAHFTQVSNKTLRDNRLTLETRGLLCYLLSHSDDYRLSKEQLMFTFKIGRNKLDRILKELKTYHYLQTRPRMGNDGRADGHVWFVYGEPFNNVLP